MCTAIVTTRMLARSCAAVVSAGACARAASLAAGRRLAPACVSLPARASSAVTKRTTGIVGLDVVPNAREVLIELYEKTLNDIKILPETAAYRQDVEKVARYRLEVVRAHKDVPSIESALGVGQAEELIEHAKGELLLIPHYAAWGTYKEPRAVPREDEYEDFFETLEYVDPESVEYLGLKQAALKKRTEAESRRAAQAKK